MNFNDVGGYSLVGYVGFSNKELDTMLNIYCLTGVCYVAKEGRIIVE